MESNQIKLSIVIPAFNEEKYIARCLDSVLMEAGKVSERIEIIVVDNASRDKTAQMAAKFPGVKVFTETKRGTNQARQRGFTESSGGLIANVDADNILPAGWLSFVFESFNKQPKLVALSGPYVYTGLSKSALALMEIFYLLAYPVYVINNRVFKSGGAVMGGNLVIKRSALEKIGGYNTSLAFHGDDTDTAIRLSKIGIVKFDYKFKIFSSSRRLKQEGFFPALFRYATNHFWISLFGKPFHKDFREIK